MKFYGKIVEGKPKIYGELDGFFETLEEGEGFEIKLIKVSNIRNSQMNNLYWWWLTILSTETGYSKKDLHSYFKEELLCHDITVGDKTVLDCESTSELNVKEFSTFLEGVARISAQNFSVVLPDQQKPF